MGSNSHTMIKMTKEQIIKIAKYLIKDARILNQKPSLSFPETPNLKMTIDIPKSLIIMLGDWQDDGEDIEVATKGLSYSISQALETDFTQEDFREI